MEPVYAIPGQSIQQIGGTCPDGWVSMQEERPGPEHIAQADGTWVIQPASPNTIFSTLD